MPIFSQVPTPPATELGTLVLGIGILVLVVDRAIQLFRTLANHNSKNDDKVDQEVDEMAKEMAELRTSVRDTREDIKRVEGDVKIMLADHKELAKGTYTRYEETARQITQMQLALAESRRENEGQLHRAVESLGEQLYRLESRLLEKLGYSQADLAKRKPSS